MEHSVVRKTVSWPLAETKIMVVDDKMVPLGAMEVMFQISKRTIRAKLFGYILKDDVLDKNTGGHLHTFVSKEGVRTFMRTYMRWRPENVAKAMRMMFEEEEEDEEEEEERSSPPPRMQHKRNREDAFLAEMRQMISGQARLEYMQSAAFKEECVRLVKERVDQMMPEIREQLRRQLEPEVREQMRLGEVLECFDASSVPQPTEAADWTRYAVVAQPKKKTLEN